MIDPKILAPVLSKVTGRDIETDFARFFRARAAIGAALGPEDQEYFRLNWPAVIDFMETAEGKEAISAFVTAWQVAALEKELTGVDGPVSVG